jgi:peroxiredoxin Q/BCP
MLKAGTPAPDFTATLDDGSEFHLASFRGSKNVVLYFYPKDFTAGCTKEACAFRDNYDEIGQHNAIIVGISADDQASHEGFRTKHGLPFQLIADPERRVIGLYDARGMLGMTARVTYVIDTEGVIRAALRHELLIGRHVPSVVRALEEIEAAKLSK